MSSISTIESSSYAISSNYNNIASSNKSTSLEEINNSIMQLNIKKMARNIEKREDGTGNSTRKSGEARADEIERLEKSLEVQLQRQRMAEFLKNSVGVVEQSLLGAESKKKFEDSQKSSAEEAYAEANNKDVEEVKNSEFTQNTKNQAEIQVLTDRTQEKSASTDNELNTVKSEDKEDKTVSKIDEFVSRMTEKNSSKDDIFEYVSDDAKDIKKFLSANRQFSQSVLGEVV